MFRGRIFRAQSVPDGSSHRTRIAAWSLSDILAGTLLPGAKFRHASKGFAAMAGRLELILNDLKELGFTEYEAKVYLALLKNHPASAYTVSQDSGVPHSRVYDVTRRLIQKGYAVSAGSNPELFTPLSPDDLIDKLRVDAERVTERVGRRLKSLDFGAGFDPVWYLRNREETLERCRTLIDDSRDRIFIGIWEEEFERLEENLRRAHERDVRVFILLYGDRPVDFGTVYHHATEHLKGRVLADRSIDASFDTDAAVSGTLGGTRRSQMIWTRNRGLVNAIEGYIMHDFCLAEIRLALGAQIDELFGPNLLKLREKFYPAD